MISDISTDDLETYKLTLLYTNKYKVDDCLYVYYTSESKELILLPFKVTDVSEETVTVTLQKDLMSEEDIGKLNYKLLLNLKNQVVFLATSSLKRNVCNVDLVQASDFTDVKVKSRIGNLTDLSLKGKELEEETSIEGIGIYSDNACFEKA